jgi:hypothetical protein
MCRDLILTFNHKNVLKTPIFNIVYEVKKDLQNVSVGKSNFNKIKYIISFPQFDVKVCQVNFELVWYNLG